MGVASFLAWMKMLREAALIGWAYGECGDSVVVVLDFGWDIALLAEKEDGHSIICH